MRLRLTVQRHRLPPNNVVWSVPDNASPQAYTIARLLEDVNNILPLEAEHWGLEDYVVEVGGYECLHFSPVAQALKDDDHVSIRPLLTAEVRSRALCGRSQISGDGRHLVDGVPFGRPYLRAANRPPIRIPPRKRQRLLDDTGEGAENVEVANLITANGETSPGTNGVHLLNGSMEVQREEAFQRLRSTSDKAVRFGQLPQNQSDSEEEEDEDFAPDDESDASHASTGSEDGSEGETSDSSEVSDSSSDPTSSSGSASENESESGEGTRRGANIAPGKGTKATQQRNKRRTEAKRLKRLKLLGFLPADANLEDGRNRAKPYPEVSVQLSLEPTERLSTPVAEMNSKKRKRDNDDAPSDSNIANPNVADNTVLEQPGENSTEHVTPELSHTEPSQPHPTAAPVPEPVPEPAPKRLRPDVSAISRILSHQTRQLDQKTPETKPASVEEPQTPPDPDFWKSKINLTAFECWDEEYTLSAPSFPFEQHWDPACQLMHEKANEQKQKKKKGGKKSPQEPVATPDESTNTIELDYGDPPATVERSDFDASAAIESQLLQDVATAAKTDLPPLPEDVESLPRLSPSDVKAGAIIVFKLMHMNPSNFNPEISGFKTAIVENEGDSGNGAGDIELRLAERDRPRRERKFTKQGNPIYDNVDKFLMGDSDNEEDGLLYHTFPELLEPKLLQAVGS